MRRDECGAPKAIAALPPSFFASSWKPTEIAGMEGIDSIKLSMPPPPATAGNTVAPRSRWDENRPGKFRIAFFRDERVSGNRVEAHPAASCQGAAGRIVCSTAGCVAYSVANQPSPTNSRKCER